MVLHLRETETFCTGVSKVTFAEMWGTPAGQDFNESGAVFALPPLPSFVQSPGIAVNQLLIDSFSSARLLHAMTQQGQLL